MRLLLVTIIAAAALAEPSHADPAADALVQKAEGCIRSGAAQVAFIDRNLEDAVNFLVNSLCAVQVHHSNNYDLSAIQLAGWRSNPATPDLGFDLDGVSDAYKKSRIEKAARINAQIAQVTINADTGELETPPGFDPPNSEGIIMRMSMVRGGLATEAQFRTVAAEAILAMRKKSLSRKH